MYIDVTVVTLQCAHCTMPYHILYDLLCNTAGVLYKPSRGFVESLA